MGAKKDWVENNECHLNRGIVEDRLAKGVEKNGFP